MSYDVVAPADVAPHPDLPGDHRFLEAVTDLETLSVQVVDAAPGEELAPYHLHEEADEVFYVLSGALHVHTPTDEYVVEAGSFFVATAESPLQPHNPGDADGPVRALLVNAPPTADARPYDPDG